MMVNNADENTISNRNGGTNMKAINIEWDIDDFEGDLDELKMLPNEIDIPKDLTDDDISDYISEVTGFCHKGFELVD